MGRESNDRSDINNAEGKTEKSVRQSGGIWFPNPHFRLVVNEGRELQGDPSRRRPGLGDL